MGAGDPQGVAGPDPDRPVQRGGGLVVEVPDLAVQQPLLPGRAGVEVDRRSTGRAGACAPRPRARPCPAVRSGRSSAGCRAGSAARRGSTAGRARPRFARPTARSARRGRPSMPSGRTAGRTPGRCRAAPPGRPAAWCAAAAGRRVPGISRRATAVSSAKVDGVVAGGRAQVVVQLEHDLAARRHEAPGALPHHRLAAAGCPGGQPRRPVEVAHRVVAGLLQGGAAEAAPAVAGGLGVLSLGRRHLTGRHREEDRVVDDGGVARQHVRPGDEGVLGQPGVDEEAAVVVAPGPGGAGPVGTAGQVQGDPALPRPQGDRATAGRRDRRAGRGPVAVRRGARPGGCASRQGTGAPGAAPAAWTSSGPPRSPTAGPRQPSTAAARTVLRRRSDGTPSDPRLHRASRG